MPTETAVLEVKPTWWSRYRPMRMDFYLLTEVLPPFAGGIFFFLFIFLMFQALRLAEFFIVHGVSAFTLLKMTLFLSLTFMSTALPISFLIAILVGFGRLSSDSELIAMKANGFSMMRLAVPLLGLALGVSVMSVYLNQDWVPWAQDSFKKTLIKVGNTKVASSLKEGTFTTGFFDLLIFTDKIDRKTNQLKKVFIYDEREPKNPLAVVARRGEILPVRTDTELGAAALLRLYDGDIHTQTQGSDAYQKISFGQYKLFLKIDEGASEDSQKPTMISGKELRKKIEQSDTGHWYGRELRAELTRRYATAFTPLFFVFLGMGFGTLRARAPKSGAALIALGVLICYWGIQAWASNQIHLGRIPAVGGMLLPLLFLGVLGTIGFRKSSW